MVAARWALLTAIAMLIQIAQEILCVARTIAKISVLQAAGGLPPGALGTRQMTAATRQVPTSTWRRTTACVALAMTMVVLPVRWALETVIAIMIQTANMISCVARTIAMISVLQAAGRLPRGAFG